MWHCPACQCGPAATDWYHGLQPLLTHAKTKGSRRIKLRRELAELLEEELHGRGTSPYPVAELFGKWKGLKDEDKDHDIIWPPMVVILNTKLEKDENDKWIGMGNQELLAYFNSFAAVKARHSYGPQGHRGISVLIFENSAGGYLEAERLHEHFSEQGTDREAWNHRQVLFLPGGKRQLYGFMALKEDLDFFNQHSQGKSKLKFELRSYQEMVVKQIRQMSEDNQQLGYFKNIVDKAQRHSKSLEASFSIVSERLRKTMEENCIVKQRTRLQHAQNKGEMDFQEQFFKDQIKIIHGARDLKEEDFEMVQQQEREKVKQSIENPSNTEDYTKSNISAATGDLNVFFEKNITQAKREKNVIEASDISGDPAQDDGGWEVYARKSKNRAGSVSAKPWATQDSSTKGWGRPDMAQKSGMRNNGGSGRNPGKTWAQTAEARTQPSWGNAKAQLTNRMPEKNYMAPQPVIPPPLERGWNWQSRAGSTLSRGFENGQKDKSVSEAYEDDADENYDDDIDDNSDAVDDSDDELLSNDFDSDTSQKSHETRKKSRWFSKFFESLDSLTVEEINEPARQWHCPACQCGPGAIDWYHSLQLLMTHAKTKGSRRVKLHRELAERLEEELHRRGTSPYPVAELFGKWNGLKDEDKDHDIIWPPLVVILNTKLEKDENDRWIRMGNQELLAYFSSYAAVKA
ncbi:hypothetical protein Patl1_14925 [Pistacia atlantica]|uniref:Uncharacterized protein n=1 Tax=Pistacia atlantica TaxID=434234 RepID=A0ACC1ASD8_9ROSI|nr:hypothetical protein Patl1_14925 [Pistacia atlantica]